MKPTRRELRKSKLVLERRHIRQLSTGELNNAIGGNVPMSPWCLPPELPPACDPPSW